MSTGAVVSPHHLATRAGERILARGGNAVDAAIAVSAALGVVYPHMTGLGGDSFWLGHGPGGRWSYNGSGRAGAAVRLGAVPVPLPARGAPAVLTVPGTPAAYGDLLADHGSLPLAAVLAPAIELAERGAVPSASQLADLATVRRGPESGALRLGPYAEARTGEVLRQEDLAGTLRTLAVEGTGAFYAGPLAERIADDLAAHGGLLTREDLAAHRGERTVPLAARYDGIEVVTCPPNSQGVVLLLMLRVVERLGVAHLDPDSGEFYGLLLRVVRACLRERDRVLADPAAVPVPVDDLLSDALADEIAGRLRAGTEGEPQLARALGGDTAYAAVVDGRGMTVSFIQSLYFEYGAGFVPEGTGVLLHNRGSLFSTDPASPNALAPGKRPFHTLMPTLAYRPEQEEPWLALGTMGGDGQAQTQLLLLLLLHHFGRAPQEALAHPRLLWGRTWGTADTVTKLEAGVSEAAARHVAALDPAVRVAVDPPSLFGHAHVIRNDHGALTPGVDPRSDGLAPCTKELP